MPSRFETIERDLRKFLREATIAYAEGGMVECDPGDTDKGAIFGSGNFTIVDRWDESPDKRVYSGREAVSQNGETIWAAGYHGEINEPADPDEILGIYAGLLKNPDENFPIRGPRLLKEGDIVYALDSIATTLSIASFAVQEHIWIKGKRSYTGHIVGGWLGGQ